MFFEDTVSYNSRNQPYPSPYRWIIHRRDTALNLIDSVAILYTEGRGRILFSADDGLPYFDKLIPLPGGDLISVKHGYHTGGTAGVFDVASAFRINPRTGRVAWSREFFIAPICRAFSVQPIDSGRILIGASANNRLWRLVIDTAGFVRDSRLGPELRANSMRFIPAHASVHQLPDRSTLWAAYSSGQAQPSTMHVGATFLGIDSARADAPTHDLNDHGGPWRQRRYNHGGHYTLPYQRYRIMAINQDGSVIQFRDSVYERSGASQGRNVDVLTYLERVNTGGVPPGFPQNVPGDTSLRWSIDLFRQLGLPRFYLSGLVYQSELQRHVADPNPRSETAYLVGSDGLLLRVLKVSGVGRRYDPLRSPPPARAARPQGPVRLYPQPATAGQGVTWQGLPQGASTLTLTDLQGRLLPGGPLPLQGGQVQLPRGLARGVYTWQARTPTGHTLARGRIVVE